MGRIGCLLIGGILFLLWAGGQKLYTGMTNRTPASMSLSEFQKNKPGAHWLKLTGCRISIQDVMYKERKSGPIEELFIPVRPEGQPAGPVHVLLATKDPGLMLCNDQMKSIQTEQDAAGYMATHKDKLVNREIQGLVRYGVDLQDKERRELSKVSGTLAPDFIILDDGKQPSMALGMLMLSGGLALSVVAFFVVTRQQNARRV